MTLDVNKELTGFGRLNPYTTHELTTYWFNTTLLDFYVLLYGFFLLMRSTDEKPRTTYLWTAIIGTAGAPMALVYLLVSKRM